MDLKPVEWMGPSKEDVRAFPRAVRRAFGEALMYAQAGAKSPHAKPLKGYAGAGVLEVVEDHDSDTYRVAYTVRFRRAVYVLHAFQKKSSRGIATQKHVLDTINQRLKEAARDYAERYGS